MLPRGACVLLTLLLLAPLASAVHGGPHGAISVEGDPYVLPNCVIWVYPTLPPAVWVSGCESDARDILEDPTRALP